MCLLNVVKLLLRPWDLDHAGGHAEQDEVSLYVQASDILHPACSVLKLQQMNSVHGHLKPVRLHQDLQLKLSALHKGKASIPLLRTPAAPKLCVPYDGVLMETRVEMENYVMPPHKIYMEPVSSWYWLTHYSHHEAGHYPCMQRKIVRQ